MANGSPIIIDVRNPEEFAEGHIEGAILIPVAEIEALAPSLAGYTAHTILLYCRSGNRSNQAAQILRSLGFTSVYDFGGILDWDGPIITIEQDKVMVGSESLSRIYILPTPKLKGDMSVEQALVQRRSRRNFQDKPLSLEQLSQILWAA